MANQEDVKLEGYFEYVHGKTELTTLQQIIEYNDFKNPEDSSQPLNPLRLLNINNNKFNITNSYNSDEKNEFLGQEQNLIKLGTKLSVPLASIDVFRVATNGNRFIFPNDDSNAFLSQRLLNIASEDGYHLHYENEGGGLHKRYTNISVWVWCKSLGDQTTPQITGKIFNLSHFVMNCSTSVNGESNSFDISLSPLNGRHTEEGWKVRRDSVKTFRDKRTGHRSFTSKAHLTRKLPNGEFEREQFLFNNMINPNDIVFIRFERLLLEEERREDENLRLFIEQGQLPNKVYDMIGLVDTNTINYKPNGVEINIAGRDLTKLLIEDGTTWINIPGLQPSEGILRNDNFANFGRPTRRFDLIGTENNPIAFFNKYRAPRIAEAMTLIFGSLATIEIAPDTLFAAYGDDISTYQQYDPATNEVRVYRGAGIWQIVKIIVDRAVSERLIVDTSIDSYAGSLLNGIQKYVQKPFVEIFGDTYGDQYFFIIRRPPFDEPKFTSLSRLTDTIPALNIKDEDIVDANIMWSDSEVYSWYRLQPQGWLNHTQVNLTSNFSLPIVYFREYNEIWGNRSLDIVSNYIHYDGFTGADTNGSRENVFDQIVEDLKYVVQSHAYLPFTRKGTITLHGDRRIKRGMCIRMVGTGEIYYVDQVQQSISISQGKTSRVTVLTVSRGMREFNELGEYILPLYFNIINFNQNPRVNADPVRLNNKFNWFVVTDVFNYFLRRQQFSDVSITSLDILNNRANGTRLELLNNQQDPTFRANV